MSNKHTVPIPTLDKVLNYKQNAQYLKLKRNKFWNLCEQKRSAYIPSSEHEAALVAFNNDYVKRNGQIPFASLCIKEGGGYSLHFKHDLSKHFLFCPSVMYHWMVLVNQLLRRISSQLKTVLIQPCLCWSPTVIKWSTNLLSKRRKVLLCMRTSRKIKKVSK